MSSSSEMNVNESDEFTNDDSNSEVNSDNEENNSNDEGTEIRGELSAMSFTELMQLKQKLGAKVYNEAIFGKSIDSKRIKRKNFKRENSNRPMEMSSKRPVPFGFSVNSRKQEEVRDPRFDPNCGTYESSKFKQDYEFVNDLRDTELKELRDKLKGTNDPSEEKKLKFVIQRMDNQLKEEEKRKQKVKETKEEETSKRIAKAEGKKPFYKKESHKKAEDLVKQYLELKNSGKLEKHLEKRRKKIKTKDRKKFNFD